MSRSTTALKRLGVPGLAAVTLVAGLPLFLGTASAAHIQGLDLSPASSTDAAGVCVPYTVQLAFTTAAQAVAETVDVNLTENGAGSATTDVDFCTAATGSLQPATPSDATDTGAAGTSDRAEFRTDAAGKVTFGVVSNAPGTVDIQAYYETTDNDTFNAGEFQDNSTETFTAGGPAGSNANQDAASFVEVVALSSAATATVTADADSDTVVETETRTYRVFVGSSATRRLNGVTVNYSVDSDVNSADRGSAVFGTTDNNGNAIATITYPVRTSAPATANSTDVVTFFVNQSLITSTPSLDPTEPRDTLTATVRDNSIQSGRTLTLTPLADTDRALNQTDPAVNEARDGDRTFRAVVDTSDTATTTTAGTLLAFTVTGGSGDETVVPVEGSTADNGATTDSNDSFVDVVVNDPTPLVGQTLTVTGTVRGTTTSATSTLTFRNTPADARSIVLTPETVTVAPNTATQLTATVRDVDGKPVQGVTVLFTESGAGAFRNGNSSNFAVTDANGVATIETLSLPGETGTQTVKADITPANTGQANQCGQAANTGTDPQGNALNTTTNTGAAGVCSDTSTVTYGAASPSPSATSTASTPPVPCTVPSTVTLERSTIIATGSSGVTVRTTPNSIVDLFAYSRPSTTYRIVRSAEVGSTGEATFRVTPPTNTRLYAQQRGCAAGSSVVLNVRTALSLAVVRNGVRNYTFSGDSLPARPGGLIISLYRVTNSGQQILAAQTRANASTGDWVINRKFTGTGRFGFVVRTGQDLQNAPGTSNVRSLLVF